MKSIKKLAEKYNLKMLILFGSQAKNHTHKESDVDLAYIKDNDLNFSEESKIKHELFIFFKKEIDLVNFKKASPLLLNEIARHGKLLFGNNQEFKEKRIQAVKKFIDFEPYFRLEEKIIKNEISKYAK